MNIEAMGGSVPEEWKQSIRFKVAQSLQGIMGQFEGEKVSDYLLRHMTLRASETITDLFRELGIEDGIEIVIKHEVGCPGELGIFALRPSWLDLRIDSETGDVPGYE